jgi:hypothetical protein
LEISFSKITHVQAPKGHRIVLTSPHFNARLYNHKVLEIKQMVQAQACAYDRPGPLTGELSVQVRWLHFVDSDRRYNHKEPSNHLYAYTTGNTNQRTPRSLVDKPLSLLDNYK